MSQRPVYWFMLFFGAVTFSFGQTMSLQECMDLAMENNIAVKIAAQSVETRQQQYEGSRKNHLPKIDLFAGYNYIGSPLKLDLSQTKDGIVTGTSSQIANAADMIYSDITGGPMDPNMKDQIYQTSHDIISAAYPNYNPEISKQSFFIAGLLAKQPIYMGGKLRALEELQYQQLESGKAMLDNSKELTAYRTALQYIQVMFYNSMIEKQDDIVTALTNTDSYAQALIDTEILPPYQKHWAEIALAQGQTNLENQKLEKENALTHLKDLMGMPLNEEIRIDEILTETYILTPPSSANQPAHNTDIKVLQTKKEEAGVALKVAQASVLPNIFAIGNVQLIPGDLPIITPPWLVGVEMQWTLFDGFKAKNQIKAAESLVEQSELLIQQKQEAINTALQVAENKITKIHNQLEILDKARKQSYTTTEMVKLRMENGLSSVKDVNDALQLQYGAEKMYYTALAGYHTAIATYYYLKGEIDEYPKTLMR